MNIDNRQESSIRISQDAVMKIAKIAALETPGVSDLYRAVSELKKLRMPRSLAAPVRVAIRQDTAVIDVHICVGADATVRDVAHDVQKNVKTAVQNTTGIAVSRINVHVDGVHFSNQQH